MALARDSAVRCCARACSSFARNDDAMAASVYSSLSATERLADSDSSCARSSASCLTAQACSRAASNAGALDARWSVCTVCSLD